MLFGHLLNVIYLLVYLHAHGRSGTGRMTELAAEQSRWKAAVEQERAREEAAVEKERSQGEATLAAMATVVERQGACGEAAVESKRARGEAAAAREWTQREVSAISERLHAKNVKTRGHLGKGIRAELSRVE